jgi:hypothetical protein
MQVKTLYAAKLLGIINHYLDGSQDTFYITETGLNFLADKKPISPAELIIVKDKVLMSTGTIKASEVKHKDVSKFNKLLSDLDKAIDDLPNEVLDFVKTGQMSLI